MSRIYHKLAEPVRTCSVTRRCIYFFSVSATFALACSWCCDPFKMCYIFRQIFPFQSEFRKDKIATWLHLLTVIFFYLPLFGRHVTSLNQGLSSLALSGLGNQGTRLIQHKTLFITIKILKYLKPIPSTECRSKSDLLEFCLGGFDLLVIPILANLWCMLIS